MVRLLPNQALHGWTFDSIYIREGVPFQLYEGDTDSTPIGPAQVGPKVVTLQVWQDVHPTEIEPGAYIVPGGAGWMMFYSIALGIEPEIKEIDLKRKANATTHHTDLFQIEDGSKFIIRRGQHFDVNVQFEVGGINLACDEFLFVAEHEFDGEPVMIQIPITAELPEDDWGAKILSESVAGEGRRTYEVRLVTPPDAPVGEWEFGAAVKRDTMENPAMIHTFPATVVLLFNPWNEADSVFMADEPERAETVLAEDGFVFETTDGEQIAPVRYEFQQFAASSLEVALGLLEGLTSEGRASAALVARHLAPRINSQGPTRPPGAPAGVIEGKWPDNDDFSGGENPKKVVSSKVVLDDYAQTGQTFKYGQCWNFAGVHTTLLRSLGIPARPVFATEVGRKLTSPPAVPMNELWYTYVQVPGGHAPIRDQFDYLWTYHIWTEAWMERPDRADGETTSGWQALDATPTRMSEASGYFGLGPAPAPAIKSGAGGNFDTSLFQLVLRGPIKRHVKVNGVWTPAAGQAEPAPIIITDANGPGVGFIDRIGGYKPGPLPPQPAITLDLDGASDLDEDVSCSATLTNPYPFAREFQFSLSWYASSNGTTGPSGATGGPITLQPGQSHTVSITIPKEEYWTFMKRWHLIVFTGIALEDNLVMHLEDTVAALPAGQVILSIEPPGPFVVGNSFEARMSFTNPLPFALTDADFFYSVGAALRAGTTSYGHVTVGTILPGQTVERTFTVEARYARATSSISGGLDSSEFFGRSNWVDVTVDPCYADWNEDTIVDALDFFAFLDIYNAMDMSADLTGSSDPQHPSYGEPDGVLDAADFFYFLDLFAAGCS